jgi:uncharacterized membrane protein
VVNDVNAVRTRSVEEETFASVEHVLGRLLLAGVSLATALLSVGLLLWLAMGPSAWALRLLDWGLIALMGTPMIRVLVSLAEYIRVRDWFFVLTTLAVAAVLIGTLLVALRAG